MPYLTVKSTHIHYIMMIISIGKGKGERTKSHSEWMVKHVQIGNKIHITQYQCFPCVKFIEY